MTRGSEREDYIIGIDEAIDGKADVTVEQNWKSDGNGGIILKQEIRTRTPEEMRAAWDAYPHGQFSRQPWEHDGYVPGIGNVMACRHCKRPVVRGTSYVPSTCFWCDGPTPCDRESR